MRQVIAFTFAILVAALPLAAQDHENVQILKDLSDLEFDRTMDFMRASLGVSCSYCHVIEGTKADFPSDAKKEKLTARKMITMTIAMNKQFFDGRTEVTCNSCHRGSTRPVAQPLLPQARPPQSVAKVERPPLPSRDDVVAKFAAAIGKVDDAALQHLSMKAVRENADGGINAEYHLSPGKTIVIYPDRRQEITPTGGNIHDAKGDREITKQEAAELNDIIEAFRFMTPRDIAADARVIRKDKIDDHDVYVVRSGSSRLFFDATSGLLVRRISYTHTPVGDAPMQTDYSDYRDVGGMKLPFVVTANSVDPYLGSTRKYSEIKLDAKE
jgi:hypothetical protein